MSTWRERLEQRRYDQAAQLQRIKDAEALKAAEKPPRYTLEQFASEAGIQRKLIEIRDQIWEGGRLSVTQTSDEKEDATYALGIRGEWTDYQGNTLNVTRKKLVKIEHELWRGSMEMAHRYDSWYEDKWVDERIGVKLVSFEPVQRNVGLLVSLKQKREYLKQEAADSTSFARKWKYSKGALTDRLFVDISASKYGFMESHGSVELSLDKVNDPQVMRKAVADIDDMMLL